MYNVLYLIIENNILVKVTVIDSNLCTYAQFIQWMNKLNENDIIDMVFENFDWLIKIKSINLYVDWQSVFVLINGDNDG